MIELRPAVSFLDDTTRSLDWAICSGSTDVSVRHGHLEANQVVIVSFAYSPFKLNCTEES